MRVPNRQQAVQVILAGQRGKQAPNAIRAERAWMLALVLVQPLAKGLARERQAGQRGKDTIVKQARQ